jgi:DnaJ-class molecular chaperone
MSTGNPEHKPDLYEILELDNTAKLEDIKKAYKRLVLIYHPDKSTIGDSGQRFIQINHAYKILSDPDNKFKYDLLNNSERINLYDKIKELVALKVPNIDSYINTLFGNENNMKDNIDKLLGRFFSKKFPNNNHNSGPDTPSDTNSAEESDSDTNKLDVHGTLHVNLRDRYINKLKKIHVSRITKKDAIFYIPVQTSQYILKSEGEYNRKTNTHGDLILEIIINEDPDFIQIDYDIYYTKYISLYDYLYGGQFDLPYLTGTPLNIAFDSFVEKFPLLTLSGKGMLMEEPERGDLIIHFKIEKLQDWQIKLRDL